jgi:outer membrane immunogenic protein
MKKLLLMTVGVTVLGMAPALAADLPMRTYTKAPVPAPVLTWGGFYLGVEGGAGSSRDTLSSGGIAGLDGSGALVGGVIGYNWELPNSVVLGIEGSFDAANIKGTSTCGVGGGQFGFTLAECHSKLDSLYSATARIGYAASGSLGPILVYAKGGAAWTNQKISVSGVDPFIGDAFAGSGSATRTGWTVGAGLEHMFAPNWSVKIEYDYYDFGNKSVVPAVVEDGEPISGSINSKLTVNTIKAGVNYHFGDPFRPQF